MVIDFSLLKRSCKTFTGMQNACWTVAPENLCTNIGNMPMPARIEVFVKILKRKFVVDHSTRQRGQFLRLEWFRCSWSLDSVAWNRTALPGVLIVSQNPRREVGGRLDATFAEEIFEIVETQTFVALLTNWWGFYVVKGKAKPKLNHLLFTSSNFNVSPGRRFGKVARTQHCLPIFQLSPALATYVLTWLKRVFRTHTIDYEG